MMELSFLYQIVRSKLRGQLIYEVGLQMALYGKCDNEISPGGIFSGDTLKT